MLSFFVFPTRILKSLFSLMTGALVKNTILENATYAEPKALDFMS